MFREGHVEVDGARLRYLEAGDGAPLVHFGADVSTPSRAHDLLARQFRVIAFEAGAAAAIGRALAGLGLADVNLMATGDAAAAALRLALAEPERVRGLVLESPRALGGDLERRLSEVTTPTLVAFGTSDDQAVQETGRVYAKAMGNGHLVFVYDAGAAIGRDRPEAFVDVVADFLERHEAFIISRTPTVIHP
jgi:pimeloyl-ACP methyl ester carboxylesterase